MSFPYLAKSTYVPLPPLCRIQLTSRLKYKSPHVTDLSFAKDEK
jgi:hypothetical protein